MEIKQYEIWLADLNPPKGTEPGRTRPFVIVQTNLMNDVHPSTIICPVASNVNTEIQLLRVHLTQLAAKLLITPLHINNLKGLNRKPVDFAGF